MVIKNQALKKPWTWVALSVAVAFALTGCDALAAPTASPAPFTLTSPAFANEQAIPQPYACQGENMSPPLAWSAPPAGTASFALIMDDPDAVAVVGYVYNHWLLFNIPAQSSSLPEDLAAQASLPDGSRHGQNNSNKTGYSGPCPPGTQSHRYVFTLYAVDTVLALEAGASKEELLAALDGHILAQAELAGQYASP